MNPKVYNVEGTEKDWAWVTEVYGVVHQEADVDPGGEVYRLVEVIEREGAATQIVTVLDSEGEQLLGVPVARYWPGAPELSPKPASAWKSKAVIGKTNSSGDVGFGMGRGDYITEPGAGVSAVWVADLEIPSDLADKLGMIAGTNHRRLDFIFQLQSEPADDSTDDPGSLGVLVQRVAAAEARLDELSASLPTEEALTALQGSLSALSAQLDKIETALQTVRQALSDIDR